MTIGIWAAIRLVVWVVLSYRIYREAGMWTCASVVLISTYVEIMVIPMYGAWLRHKKEAAKSQEKLKSLSASIEEAVKNMQDGKFVKFPDPTHKCGNPACPLCRPN